MAIDVCAFPPGENPNGGLLDSSWGKEDCPTNCAFVESEILLVADFQVDCYDTEHLALEAFAVIMVFAFPIGVPCALFLVLFVNRRELNKDASKRRELFSPLVDTYRIELWWWEAVEMLRKVTLTGLLIFFNRGSIYQLAVGIQCSAVFTSLAVYARPYKDDFTNNLYVVTNFAVLVTFNIGILLSDRIDKSREQLWVQDQSFLDAALFLANVFAPAAVVAYELLRRGSGTQADSRKASKEAAIEEAQGTMSDEFMQYANPLATK